MYFDPLSTWLVTLIADGIIVTNEKFGDSSAQSQYDQERIKQGNQWLNSDIRRVKEKYGLFSPEMAYNQIQLHIKTTKNTLAFKYANGQIMIDLDNQEYIILVLEACAKRYNNDSPVEEHRKKAEWYKKAAIEARKRKEQYTKNIEETYIEKRNVKEKQQSISNIYMIIGLIILIIFLIIFFS